MKSSNLSHFNQLAKSRIKQRRAKSYYWNDITKFVNLSIEENNSVLEIGCGTSELMNELKAKKKVGIDFSEEMITEAKKQFPHLELYTMAAEEFVLQQKFDVIILSNLIGYLEDIQQVFENLHLLCHSDTKIIITYYNFLWEPILKFGEFIGYKTKTPNQNWLSLNEINNLLNLSGFKVYQSSRSMLIPIYIPLISEFLNLVVAKIPFFHSLCINSFSLAKLSAEQKSNISYSVSIIVPACNESGNIQKLVERLPALGSITELIFVESNSTDNTWEKIKEVEKNNSSFLKIKSIRTKGQGKGEAVRKGFENASGDILMILDADLSVAPEDLIKFYNAIASGKADFINGSRLVYPMEKEAMRFLNLLGNKIFSLVFSWLLNQRIKDTLCGTKVLFKKDYERLNANRSYFGDFDPFGDFDLLFGAYKLNLKMIEVPIRYHERTYGRTNISRFKHGWLLLKMCVFATRKIKFGN